MKKWFIVCLTVLLCAGLIPTVSAAGMNEFPDGYFATSNDLFQYWHSTYPPQYPDYVGGVWTENGTAYPLTFALTDDAAGDAGHTRIEEAVAIYKRIFDLCFFHTIPDRFLHQSKPQPYFEFQASLHKHHLQKKSKLQVQKQPRLSFLLYSS